MKRLITDKGVGSDGSPRNVTLQIGLGRGQGWLWPTVLVITEEFGMILSFATASDLPAVGAVRFKIVTFIRQRKGVCVGNEAKLPRFLEAMLWITRSSSQWRLTLEQSGKFMKNDT